MNIATKATVSTVPTDKLHGPTLEEGMRIVEWLEKHGGVPEDLPEPYRAEYARRLA